jgi:hypothetical protein
VLFLGAGRSVIVRVLLSVAPSRFSLRVPLRNVRNRVLIPQKDRQALLCALQTERSKSVLVPSVQRIAWARVPNILLKEIVHRLPRVPNILSTLLIQLPTETSENACANVLRYLRLAHSIGTCANVMYHRRMAYSTRTRIGINRKSIKRPTIKVRYKRKINNNNNNK